MNTWFLHYSVLISNLVSINVTYIGKSSWGPKTKVRTAELDKGGMAF